MPKFDSNGAVPLPLLVAAIAVIGFISVASIAPFREGLLNALYGKPSSFAATGTINVNPAQTFQRIDGWEATDYSGEDSPQFSQYNNSIFDNLVNNLGINRLRLEVRSGAENSTDYWTSWKNAGFPESGSAWDTYKCNRYATVNDNSDPNVINPSGFKWSNLDNTIDKVVLPLRQRMQAKGEQLFINLNYVAFTGQITCGGQYIHNNSAEYAEFVLATYQHMQSKYGFVPDSWEVILEPDNSSQWSNGTVIGNAIKAAGDKLAANGYPNVKFIAPSTTCMDRAPSYFDQIKAVSGALAYVDIFSYHRYCGVSASALQQIVQRATQNNKKTAQLEHIASGYEDLHEDLKVGNNSVWQQFTIGGPCNNQWPCEDGGGEYFYFDITANQLKWGWRTRLLRQYFAYIKKGAQRIGASSADGNFDPVAFINPDGKYVVVVKANQGGNFSIGGLPDGSYGINYTLNPNAVCCMDNFPNNISFADQNVSAGSVVNVNMPNQGAITIYQKTVGAPPSSASPSPVVSPSPSAAASIAPSISPSPIVSPSPLPSANGSLTVSINSGGDDVNEDGSTFDTSASTVWLGNGASTTASFLGLRFNAVNIPKNAIITSAKIEVLPPSNGWIGLSYDFYGDNTGNSSAFSLVSKPSQRSLTVAKVSHTSDVQWLANQKYQLNDITSIIQEIVNRSDWNPGNSLSIILKGTAGAFARKNVTAFEGSAVNAPKLIITYSIPSPTPGSLAKPGDIDGNGSVNIFDYNILLTDFGKSGVNLPADIDRSGKVDIFDYNILLTNFGK